MFEPTRERQKFVKKLIHDTGIIFSRAQELWVKKRPSISSSAIICSGVARAVTLEIGTEFKEFMDSWFTDENKAELQIMFLDGTVKKLPTLFRISGIDVQILDTYLDLFVNADIAIRVTIRHAVSLKTEGFDFMSYSCQTW